MMLRQQDRKPPALTARLPVWLVLLCWLISFCATAATTEPAGQDSRTKARAELEKTAEQPASPLYPPTFTGAKQAFKDNNHRDALEILAKLEGDYAGNVEYDYLLGRSALETKNFDLAVAAFVRVLTVDPDFAAARFELARAYYSKGVALLARGPFEQARSEFRIVASMNPPPELRQAIAQYQANIDKYLEVREAEFNMFVEMTGGYDSNIGTTSKEDYFSYYDPYSTTTHTYDLRDRHEEKASEFGQVQAGIGIAWPLFSNNFEVFGNLTVGGRAYSSNHGYDHSWDQVRFGARHYGKDDRKTLRFSFRKTDVQGEFDGWQRYHEQGEVMFEWAVKYDDKTAYTVWLMGGDSSYHAHGTYVFSVNYNRQGAEVTRLLEGKRKAAFQVLLVNGRDDPQECEDAMYCPEAYTRDIKGIRLGWGVNIFGASRFYSSFYLEDSRYDHDFFFQRRKDRRMEVFLAVNTPFGDSWYFRPEIHYTHNDSSIDLYDHERWVVAMTFGWGI